MQFSRAPGFSAKRLQRQPEGTSGTLNDGSIRGSVTTHEHSDPDHTIATDYRHLGGGAILHDVQKRNDCCCRKQYVGKCIMCLVDHIGQRQRNQLQVQAEDVRAPRLAAPPEAGFPQYGEPCQALSCGQSFMSSNSDTPRRINHASRKRETVLIRQHVYGSAHSDR